MKSCMRAKICERCSVAAADLRARQRAAQLDVPHDRVLERRRVLLEQRAERVDERHAAQRLKHVVGAAQVGRRFLDVAADVGEHAALRLEHRRHRRFDRQPAEIRAPRDARARELALQRSAEPRRRRRRARSDRARPVPRARAGTAPRPPPCAPSGPTPPACPRRPATAIAARGRSTGASRRRCRSSPGCAASRRGRCRRRARPSPHASATAAPPLLPPHVFGRIVRVARGAEYRVERLRSGSEFRHVRLAECDRARTLLAFDDDAVLIGYEVVSRWVSRTSCACRASRTSPCARRAARGAARAFRRERALRRHAARPPALPRRAASRSRSARGLTRSIRARCAAMTSRAETSLLRIRRSSSVADSAHKFVRHRVGYYGPGPQRPRSPER